MINGMDDFQKKCRLALIAWYMQNNRERIPEYEETYVVWSVKVLQNYKCLVSTSMPDTIYAEFTHNGNSGCTYQDTYERMENRVYDLQDMDRFVQYYGKINE